MPWLYVVGFIMGVVHTVSGTASQIVLTQVVARERLVEAHAKNALASSGAEVLGPGIAGALIKLAGAPLALLVDAAMLVFSALILRGIRVTELRAPQGGAHFWRDLKAGVRFVAGHRLLLTLAVLAGGWQMCNQAALVVQLLHATRTLGLSEQAVGLSYVAMGVGTVTASVFGHRFTRRVGPGPSLLWGCVVCGCGWLLLASMPAGPWGVAAFALMLLMFGVGAVLIFINFLALRQAVTPEPLLGRMTSTMRWLSLLPAGPGALLGGWLGEHYGLRSALVFAGATALLLALFGWRQVSIRALRELPRPDDGGFALGAEAGVGPAGAWATEGR
jgi:MFS family permease